VLEGYLKKIGLLSLSPETLEAVVFAKDWLFGLNDADEGKCRI